jgi:hypothetical protein
MARPLRMKSPSAFYRVIVRGNGSLSRLAIARIRDGLS